MLKEELSGASSVYLLERRSIAEDAHVYKKTGQEHDSNAQKVRSRQPLKFSLQCMF